MSYTDIPAGNAIPDDFFTVIDIRSRPVGVMYMTDEAGADAKVIAVPHEKLSSMYSNVKECSDLPALLLAQIQHFFENYKALEPGKWVKMGRWGSADEAREDIRKSVAAYNLKKEASK
ncbi:MAG: hypothetical protein EOP12_00395 [Pseudomonas sp.]|nr:MAG: hypothetical protein EOP12_00395 [Pseudomonas sp.]